MQRLHARARAEASARSKGKASGGKFGGTGKNHGKSQESNVCLKWWGVKHYAFLNNYLILDQEPGQQVKEER